MNEGIPFKIKKFSVSEFIKSANVTCFMLMYVFTYVS